MSMSPAAAGELIDERVAHVATVMRIGRPAARRYLDDDAVRSLAATLAVSFADEAPGANLLSAPRDAEIPVRLAGRVSAGLGEALRIRLAETSDLEHIQESVAQLAHGIGTLGLVIADQVAEIFDGEPWVRVPAALLRRLARYLEAAAGLAEAGVVSLDTLPEQASALADALRDDATALRDFADGLVDGQ